MADASRDSNRTTALLGVSSINGETPVKIKADPTTGELLVQASIDTSDIEIGAVEIKNATDDTRVVVKSDGTNNALVVTQNSQPLPTGASTSAKQDTGNTSLASIKTNTDTLLPLSTIYNNTHTVPTVTSDAIATTQAISSVTIKALSTNTVAVYVGGTGVTTTTGFELLAGESVTLDVNDLAKVFVISGSAAQIVRYIAI